MVASLSVGFACASCGFAVRVPVRPGAVSVSVRCVPCGRARRLRVASFPPAVRARLALLAVRSAGLAAGAAAVAARWPGGVPGAAGAAAVAAGLCSACGAAPVGRGRSLCPGCRPRG